MQSSLSNIESVDNGSSPSAQSSECRNERLQGLRTRLKLQPFSSCKAAIPSSAGEARTQDVGSSEVRNSATYKLFDKFYAQMEEIGQGSCGVVKKVFHIEENLIYAAKIMKSAESENIEQMKREYQILSTLDHKNIIKAKEFFHDETSGSAQLVLEYFPSKNLEELIKEGKEGRRLEEEKVRQIIQQVVSALKYVHEKGVCHRDITASNILVNDKNEVKLIDFSISRINRQELWSPTAYKNMSSNRKRSDILSGYQTFMISNAGTDAYKAPEIVTGVPYNQSVDMWSLGVVTFYALAGYRPFRSRDANVLYKKISDVDYVWDATKWASISHEGILFVQACLKKLPFIRLSSKEAYYHPWTKGVKMDWEICEISERGSEENEKDEKNKKNKRKPVVLSPSPSRRDKAVDRRAREKFGKSYALDVATIN